jgi:uncharacterized protein
MTPDEAKVALKALSDGLTLKVKVVPQAQRTRIVGLLGDRVKLFVTSPPESGKANETACNCIAMALGVAKTNVQVAQGHTQSSKVLLIRGVTLQEAADRLALCTPGDGSAGMAMQ